jgi:hypothetical protein
MYRAGWLYFSTVERYIPYRDITTPIYLYGGYMVAVGGLVAQNVPYSALFGALKSD